MSEATTPLYCTQCLDEFCFGEQFYRFEGRRLCRSCLIECALTTFVGGTVNDDEAV